MFAAAGYYDTSYGTLSLILPEWAPMQALTGDTHTNTTLDNLNLTTILKAGDFISGTGIPSFTRVASIAGNVATLTQATTATATGVTLFYGRLKAPTLTAAF